MIKYHSTLLVIQSAGGSALIVSVSAPGVSDSTNFQRSFTRHLYGNLAELSIQSFATNAPYTRSDVQRMTFVTPSSP